MAPDGAAPGGDLPLHLPLARFREQIERLGRTHRFVSLAELTAPGAPARGRPRVAITFDDAYRGAVTLALPVLAELGVPATLFVPPGLVGAPAFWWDELATAARGLEPTVRRRALGLERGTPARGRGAGPRVRRDQAPADLDELLRAAAYPGVSLAPHSWTHPNLTALDDAELAAELARPRAWLLERFPLRTLPDHLAFPYGLWDERVARAARALGYRFLYRVDGGVGRVLAPGCAPLPRINVPAGVSGSGFSLRTAGLIR